MEMEMEMEMMKTADDHKEHQHEQQKQPQLQQVGIREIVEEEDEGMMRGRIFHVLAVDDSQIERKILEKLLTVSSYQVTSVESGDKALEYLGLLDSPPSCEPLQGHGMRVNLIMTDYSMPGMSGYDLLKRVKGSSWKDVPVIVMSSENVPSRIHMCLEEGAEEFLLKPVRLSDLKKLHAYVMRSSRCCCCVENKGEDLETGIGSIGGNSSICKDKETSSSDECKGNFGNMIEETIAEKDIMRSCSV